jgi:Putative peptidoglycan binding domain/HlyD family secretion protein
VSPPASAATAAGGLARRRRQPSRRLGAGLALALGVAGVALVVTNPFAGGGAGGAASNRGARASLATVTRRPLSAQTQVDGTLGYAGSASILAPTGKAQADVRQAEQAFASAEAALRAAQTGLAADERALALARAKLTSDRFKQASTCRGANAAAAGNGSGNGSGDGSGNGSGDGGGNGSGSGSTPCASAAQAVASDEQSVASAARTVTGDRGTLDSNQVALANARQSLVAAQASATPFGDTAAFTMLPAPGRVVHRGEPLYAVDGQPVLLLYGRVAAWRAFRRGMSPGRDVAELNANLRALGYSAALGSSFTAATERAIRALQSAHGTAPSGVLGLGAVAFKPAAVRIKSVAPTVGQAVQPGPVLTVTSTHHQVAIQLDAAQQSEVKVGDPVTVTLPDNSTTPGRVTSVGKVASSSGNGSDNGSGGGTPTIAVTVRLRHESAAGQLVAAPVQVAITTASVKRALVVPVNALLALASGGGYAVEVVNSAGVHHLVPVTLGLFDDAEGLVQVRGAGLHAGQRIVEAAS